MENINKKVLLQINGFVNTGSTGRISEQIGMEAINSGWNSYIAFGRQANQSKSILVKISSKVDIIIHFILTRLFDYHGLASTLATRKFINKINEIKPDIIHLHNIHGYYINYKVLFRYLAIINKPVVWTLHDCWSFTGHCAYYSFVNCSKWQIQCRKCSIKSSYPKSVLFDRSEKNFENKKHVFNLPSKICIIPVSNWLKNDVAKSFLKKYPQKVIHNGIDLDVFFPSKGATKERYNITGKFVILGIANIWDERKGLSDFIQLSQFLLEDEIIFLVGLSQKQISKLPYNIIGIQRTESTSTLAELYSSSNLFFNPTREDNYPTTNLEAIACGTPVVTYKTGGSIESITKETGFIVEQGDLAEVRHIIDLVKEQGEEHYVDKCRNHAIANFDGSIMYKEYISLYDSLLEE